MAGFDVNTKALIGLTAKLGSLHRSALPVAIRQTLNKSAFETKKVLPEFASRKFITRNKSFFRSFSSVNKARGFQISGMSAEVGINPAKGDRVADGLVKQETGGSIKGRKLIPLDKARISNSHGKKVRRQNQFRSISKIHEAGKGTGRNVQYLLIKKGSSGTVFRVKRSGKKRQLIPLYAYRNERNSRVKASPFMKPASMKIRKDMPRFYVEEANKQIKRLLK